MNVASSVLRIVSLTHWGQVMHLGVSKLTSIASDNGLLPGRHQAIIWTNAGILSIGPLGTNFSEILSEIHTFSFKKMRLKMSSGKWRPFCLSLNVLIDIMAWTKWLRFCGWYFQKYAFAWMKIIIFRFQHDWSLSLKVWLSIYHHYSM